MHFVLDTGLPLLVVFVMTVVGLELTAADFANVRRYPKAMALALAGQWIALPLAAMLIVQGLGLAPALAGAIAIIAAAPVAALSNYYALLARANLALAVTLTAVSSLAATATMPLIATLGFRLLRLEAAGLDLPIAKLLAQTMFGLLLPVLFGMVLRRLAPGWAQRQRRLLQLWAALALVVIIAIVLIDQIDSVLAQLKVLVAASLLYTLSALGAGWLLGSLATSERDDRCALLFGFPARNVAIATLVAVATLGRTDVAAFGAVFFLVQAMVLIPLALSMAAAIPPRRA